MEEQPPLALVGDKPPENVETRPETRTMPGRNGGWLTVGGRESPGRPPDAFKARMAKLADRAAQALEVAKILDDATDPMFLDAAKWAADRGYGKPEQPTTVRGTQTIEIVLRNESKLERIG